MEQEYDTIQQSPINVRRQLLFVTPINKRSFYVQKTPEIQYTPKGKVSKPKAPFQASKQKVFIDFGVVGNNLFMNQGNSFGKLKPEEEEEESPIEEDYHTKVFGSDESARDWYFNSPFQTASRSKLNSGSFGDYISVGKDSSKGRSFGESPFCKLLNESDRLSVKSYQTLVGINEIDEEQEYLKEKHFEQINVVSKFFHYFEERSVNVMDLFVKDSIFEVIGEEKVYSLEITLNALAKAFLKFECHPEHLDFDFKLGYAAESEDVIITASGKLTSSENQSDFILSAKVLVKDLLISHIKLQIS